MMPPQAPTKIDISVANQAVATLPASLEQRLQSSPTKSPDELAAELKAHQDRTERLRRAHLDAVRDRAARESQRAAEAAARKLRLAASRVEKVQRKLVAAENKTNAKKEASQAEREARKARRAEMALAVAEARRAAVEARELRQSQLLEAEKHAFLKHAKLVQEVADKSSAQVRHAVAVVAAQKEKERLEKEAKSESLAAKLQKAAVNRDAIASPATEHVASRQSARVARVLNDSKVASAMKRLVFDAKTSKASSKRQALLDATSLKAQAENLRVSSVVEKLNSKKDGTDAATVEAKAALYDKLLRAEVSRLSHLKTKYVSKPGKGDTISAIVVRIDAASPRMPPPTLARRLSVVERSLVATAVARQAGAAARRGALKAAAALKAAKANERRAAASARIGKSLAAVAAKSKAKAAAATVALALLEGRRLHAQAEVARRTLGAGVRRAAAEKALLAKAQAAQAKIDAADERHESKLRAVAKAGVVAVRAAAFTSRRDAYTIAALARGNAHAERCAAAANRRAALVAARVALAKKRQAATHPKREVADMEIKSEWSEA